jgi:glycosyltransferase involved in cell wall biosynthesis
MARVDWCIVPSLWEEAFCLVISEAWQFRRPVISSDIGAMAERVADDVDGLHFTRGDPDALAAAIRRACTETGLWERLSDAAPQPPSLAAMVEGFLDVYGLTPMPIHPPVQRANGREKVVKRTDTPTNAQRPSRRPARASNPQ